jgi:hypothetical protein
LGGAFTLLLNVIVPHVPATLCFRQCTPDVATAVRVHLPVMSRLMAAALREEG